MRNEGKEVRLDPIRNLVRRKRLTEIEKFANELQLKVIIRSSLTQSFYTLPGFRGLAFRFLNKNLIQETVEFHAPNFILDHSSGRISGYWQTIETTQEVRSLLEKNVIPQHGDRVAMHVRRGDYLSPEHSIHGVLQGDYYLKAYEFIAQKEKINFLDIFTDSPDILKDEKWLKKLDIKWQIQPQESTLNTFHKMAEYSNIICSNSTYSWWAALIHFEDKLICLPKTWTTKLELPKNLNIPGSHKIDSTFYKDLQRPGITF